MQIDNGGEESALLLAVSWEKKSALQKEAIAMSSVADVTKKVEALEKRMNMIEVALSASEMIL